ncbi:gibberellin 2-beta-dioxygenase 2-like [Wolffia australiana]
MVVASPLPIRQERVRALGIPVVDLGEKRGLRAEEEIVRACEEFGFFKVINHGVPEEIVGVMEAAAMGFFGLPSSEKERAGPPSPLGYGIRSIGLNGDTGEVEYLLLPANRAAVTQRASSICRRNPGYFSRVVAEYVDAVRGLAGDILEMIGGGLHLQDRSVFSKLACNDESDSLIRLNYYPPCAEDKEREEMKEVHRIPAKGDAVVVGFGEHTDPQVLTVLRSNDAPGLQVLFPPDADGGGGVWVPVAPDPSAFFIIVGDVLQAMTNGRLLSARHRAVVSNVRARLSTVYFAAPPLQAPIAPLLEMVGSRRCGVYKPFTWGEYKKAMYALRLGHNRLDFFRQNQDDAQEQAVPKSF